MPSDNQNTKLFITAAGSAIAGGLAAVALMKLYGKQDNDEETSRSYYDTIPRRQSLQIFEDPDSSESQKILYPFNHEEKMRLKVAARQAVEEDNSLPRNSVTVRVPATSANMGPGCEYWRVWIDEHLGSVLMKKVY